MSTLSALRETVGACLTGLNKVTVYTFVPEAVMPPAVIVQPGTPYLTTDDEPYGFYRVRWRVALIADSATNEVATESLDQLICDAIAALSATFAVEEIEEPYVFRANDNMYLAADLIISDSTTI